MDKEISIEELVDRYYQKPEDYFTDSEPPEAPKSGDSPDDSDNDHGKDSNNEENININTGPERGSNNNISETLKTGSSHNETNTNMQKLDNIDVKDIGNYYPTVIVVI